MSFMLVGVCLAYFGSEYNQMMNFYYDQSKEQQIANNFITDHTFLIEDTNFLPMLELVHTRPLPNPIFNIKDIDEFAIEEEIINPDLQKISKLMQIVSVYRDRTQFKDERIITPFRACTQDDFTKRGYIF